MLKSVAIIPARGGSKRIPRKNAKLFFGKPIIAYSIEVALKSKLFDIIMVSTDDSEIASLAVQYGAEVPFLRSSKTSDDYATTFDVVEEVLKNYELLGTLFPYACCIYPCVPFLSKEKLLEGYNTLITSNFDSVFPVVEFTTPIQRALKVNESNKINFFYDEYSVARTQDVEKSYHDAGQFYWMNTERCLNKKAIVTDNTGAVVISEMESQDIDNQVDWKLAELKYELLQSSR